MICKREWVPELSTPGHEHWCDLVDEHEELRQQREDIGLQLLGFCVAHNCTLEEAIAHAKENM